MPTYKHTAIPSEKMILIANIQTMNEEVQAAGRSTETDTATFQKLSEIFEVWDKHALLTLIKEELPSSPAAGEPKQLNLYTGTTLSLDIYKLNNATIEIKNGYFAFYLLSGFATSRHNDTERRHGGNTQLNLGEIQAPGIKLSGTGMLVTPSMSPAITRCATFKTR